MAERGSAQSSAHLGSAQLDRLVSGHVNTNIDICIITHVFDSYLSLLKETHLRVSFSLCEYKYINICIITLIFGYKIPF